MPWAQEEDLLVGDLALGSTDTGTYLDAAEDEINARIGQIYELPVPTLTVHESAVFKIIHSRLASGRLIMAQAIGGENTDLHEYGKSLVVQAYDELARIGVHYELTNGVRVTVGAADRTPSASNPDTVSPFDVYNDYVYGQANTFVDWSTS